MARGASSVAGSATLELERDLRVDTIIGDPIVVVALRAMLALPPPDVRVAMGALWAKMCFVVVVVLTL
jgi:hypothetical protein